MTALDSKYVLDMPTLIQEIPNFTGTLCAQLISINTFNSQLYSRGQAEVNLYKKETGQHMRLEELVNFMEVDFAMSPATFVNNQTVCVDQDYQSDSCMT